MPTLYTAIASSTGQGRNGHVRSSDGLLELDLATPKEMGGPGGASNPEQLFAAGYAACFHSALKSIAAKGKVDVTDSAVTAEVGIGPDDAGGFGLSVALLVELSGVDQDTADALVEAAHGVCLVLERRRGATSRSRWRRRWSDRSATGRARVGAPGSSPVAGCLAAVGVTRARWWVKGGATGRHAHPRVPESCARHDRPVPPLDLEFPMSHLDAPFAPTGEHVASTPDAAAAPQQPDAGAPFGAPVVPSRRSGLALAAFVVALVSLLVSAIPFVNAVSVVGGLVAVVLAVVALRKLVPGVTGKGFAIAGIVLGALAVVVAAVVWVVTAMAIQAIESGELDAVLEEAAAAQESALVEQEVVEDVVATDDATAPSDAASADPAAAVAGDFSDITCDVLAEEAVAMSAELAEGGDVLTAVTASAIVEDHRTDATVPAGDDESLVLSCQGTATWADATESPVLTELTLDANGELAVYYAGE